MRHGSLFSGIGGFDLAAEWMGWENVLHCEINEFGRKVLTHYWPEAISLSDIHKAKFKRDERGNVWVRRDGVTENAMHSRCVHGESEQERAEVRQQRNTCTGDCNRVHSQTQDKADWLNIGAVDIITGGFPCQPFSMAGKRKGTDDERHLWPQMLRAIREIQPRWIVGENVPGLVNWSGGLVFEQVQADLETEGYEVQAFILPACGVNAPHRRDRVWIVAHSVNGGYNTGRKQIPKKDGIPEKCWQAMDARKFNGTGFSRPTPDTTQTIGKSTSGTRTGGIGFTDVCAETITSDTDSNIGCERRMHTPGHEQTERHAGTRYTRFARTAWQNFPTQPPVCGRNDGLSSRLAGITFSKHRNESIKAYGNAVVPNVVYQIFKAIQQYEDTINNATAPGADIMRDKPLPEPRPNHRRQGAMGEVRIVPGDGMEPVE